jgi:CubicO group peptidase (beta-lactamase class C family)
MRKVGVLALVLFGCSGEKPSVKGTEAVHRRGTPAPKASATAPVVLTADSSEATTGGTVFIAPTGFTILRGGDRILLTGPERDLRIAIVDAPEPSADDAVAGAWKALRPDFKRPIRITHTLPARDGWEERRAYAYETSPDEMLVVAANAFRKGAKWTVVVLEGSEASFDKRAAAVARIDDTLRPKDYIRETFAGKKAKALDAERIKAITAAVDRARTIAAIPGVALSLVQDGRVVYEGGLGVRDLGKPAKVDAKSLFVIAANTKALTTLLLAKLVDEKKLTWERNVTDLDPTFKLGDEATTKRVQVKHLVCACTGLPRQDYEWLFEFEKSTPKSILESLAKMQPTTAFGETFQYSKPLAAAAGFLGGHVVFPDKEIGAAYDEAMKTRVLEPLAMNDTTFDFARALRGNVAMPHEYDVDGKIAPAVMDLNRSIVPVRPAGGAWSNVRDMSKYVLMELAKGALPDGKRYIGEEALLARRAPQVSIGEFVTYGMGLEVDREWGVSVVHHGGEIIGYHSDMFWIPEANVGGVILTNGPGFLIRRAFIRKTLEALYDGRPEAEEDAASAIARYKASVAVVRSRLVVPPDPAVVSGLSKRYTNAELGDVAIAGLPPPRGRAGEGAVTTLDFGGWKSPFATRKNDDGTVSLVTTAPGGMGIMFTIGAPKDGKRTLVVRDMQHEYVFVES